LGYLSYQKPSKGGRAVRVRSLNISMLVSLPRCYSCNYHYSCIRPAQFDFTLYGLEPISEGHSCHYAGAPYKCLYGGAHTNRRKSPKIRASGRPPRVTHITTDRKSSCTGLMLCERSRARLARQGGWPARGSAVESIRKVLVIQRGTTSIAMPTE
jgi:hypothetical protein